MYNTRPRRSFLALYSNSGNFGKAPLQLAFTSTQLPAFGLARDCPGTRARFCLSTTTTPFTLVHCRSFFAKLPEQRRAPHSRHHSIHDAIQRQSGIMKYNILTATALAFSTLASSTQLNVHGLEDLVPRDIDPKTMDPTRLSVLSVLRTAIPSGTDFPKPSGDFEPDWYKNLPADVKSLLPSLYPVTITSTSTSTSTATVHVSAAASTPTSTVSHPTPSAAASIAVLGPPLTRSE
jgi:hypothetical protein